jgi:hypothetical protein
MSGERPEGGGWIDDWQSGSPRIETAGTLSQDIRRAQRRRTLISAIEVMIAVGLLAFAGFAVVRSTQITDTMWLAGGVAFLVFAVGAVAIAGHRVELALGETTISLVAAYERACQRRLRAARLATIVLALELAALVPFGLWRYRVDPASFTSHHGIASAIGTMALVVAATIWTRRMTSRARVDLRHAQAMHEELATGR